MNSIISVPLKASFVLTDTHVDACTSVPSQNLLYTNPAASPDKFSCPLYPYPFILFEYQFMAFSLTNIVKQEEKTFSTYFANKILESKI